jgi:thiol-disulfide isomerase/thioredoxin
MMTTRSWMSWTAVALLLASAGVWAQSPTPSAPGPAPVAAPAPPPSPVNGIRNKVSAGDLLSAESILEVHRSRYGEDDGHLTGLSWLARGAFYLGDRDKARRYVSDARRLCASRLTQGGSLETDRALETALGAAIEVEAQLIERERGARPAADFVQKELAQLGGPIAFRARLNKRINALTLVGAVAPEIAIEDSIGEQPPTLRTLKGRPVVLFLWANGCPDCEAQAEALARVRAQSADKGLRVLALTRYYSGNEAQRAVEKKMIEAGWQRIYTDLGPTPVVISAASMERYGGSSTPTFVFIDRAGIVRGYTPTRLTEAELAREVAKIVR